MRPLSKERREEIEDYFEKQFSAIEATSQDAVIHGKIKLWRQAFTLLIDDAAFYRDAVKTAHATHCHSVCDGIDAACSFCGGDETGDPIKHRPGCAWVAANE